MRRKLGNSVFLFYTRPNSYDGSLKISVELPSPKAALYWVWRALSRLEHFILVQTSRAFGFWLSLLGQRMNLLKETPNGGKNYKCHHFKEALIIPHQKLTDTWSLAVHLCYKLLVYSDSDQAFQLWVKCYCFGVLMCMYIYLFSLISAYIGRHYLCIWQIDSDVIKFSYTHMKT